MIETGTLVRILYPNFAIGCKGTIQNYDNVKKRWIVRLEQNKFEKSQKPIFLYLDDLDFRVV